MMEETLLVFVLNELERRKGAWPSIARDTGLDYSWLTKLAQRRIPDPSVNKIQVLADYFHERSDGRFRRAADARAEGPA